MSYVAPVPKIIFQTWKSHTVIPDNFRYWSNTWKLHHPDYEYILWDDADNRAFMADNFAWFLPTFDGYPKNINRADAVRYFFLYYYGGIYADMDFECLRPIDSLLTTDASVILGRMDTKNANHSIPNAIMISKPRDPFWIYVFQQLVRNKGSASVEATTGPIMLYEAVQAFNKKDRQIKRNRFFPVKTPSDTYNTIIAKLGPDIAPNNYTTLSIVQPALLYPLSWAFNQTQRKTALNNKDFGALTQMSLRNYPTAYAVTYWTHGW
jgi:mannosyltransferase OCH1-like enzyme